MAVDPAVQGVEGGSRRWSEPVPIGAIVADLRALIETRRQRMMQRDPSHSVAPGPLRKAG